MEEKNLPEISIADDFLIQVAEQAERRIDAVIKIKKVALKVTNARDWTDQQGNPYLQVSGAEKVANLFNMSWRIDEPTYEEDPDGHYTYSYKGYFSLGSRTAEAEGSRSSRDGFFKQYSYEEKDGKKEKKEVLISDRTNKRDVKMAALTNLLGNGITRILGIRNLTWEDLKEFAGITKEQVTSIQYRKEGEPIREPQKKNGNAPKDDTLRVITQIMNITQKDGFKSDKKTPYTLYTIMGQIDGKEAPFKTFSKSIFDEAMRGKGTTMLFEIEYKSGQYGHDIVNLKEIEPQDENAQS
jgi:hypothetical protein